jgi:hypothetical protein
MASAPTIILIRAMAVTALQVDPKYPWLIAVRLSIIAGVAGNNVGFGCFSLCLRMLLVRPVADDILAGESFKPDTLLPLIPTIQRVERDANCHPMALRSTAVVRLYLSERDSLSTTPGNAIRRALACTPTDSFLWLALFSAEMAQNGLRGDYFQYLRMSYQLGPHEGWIALKRNRVVVPILHQLPNDLAEAAVNEFAELVDNQLYPDAADILLGAGLEARDKLVLSLVRVRDRNLEQFAVILRARGYDLPLPKRTPTSQ